MASPKLRIWRCPRCDDGVRAPSRPRRDDVRRYCLECSKETGRLVERRSPSLERERAARSAALATKHKDTRARARAREEARYTVRLHDAAGNPVELNLRDELRRLCRLRAFGGPRGRFAKSPPELVVRRGSYGNSGSARWLWDRIVVTVTEGSYVEAVRELLLHELVHVKTAGTCDTAHDLKFKRKLAEAVGELWPSVWVGSLKRGAYVIDRDVVRQLREAEQLTLDRAHDVR